MLKFQNVVAVLSALIGIFFMTQIKSDIQLGFGLLLIIQGILGYRPSAAK